MKKTIVSTLTIFMIIILFGYVNNYAEQKNPALGQWINQNNDILQFTSDYKVFLNGQEVGKFKYNNATEEIIIKYKSSSNDIKEEYYKLVKDKQNSFQLINMDSEKNSKEKTFSKIYPRVD